MCDKEKAFWISLTNWWNSAEGINIDLTSPDIMENLLFGFMLVDKTYKAMNFVILNAKMFIYKERLFNDNPISLYRYL